MAPPAEAPPPAETTEPPARVTDWGDRLTTTIALPGAGLDLLATPRSEPASVGLRLTKLSRTAELSDCAMLVLSSGTGRVELPVRYESAAVSGHIEERLIVLTTVDVLERLVAEGDIRITLCTRTWEVGHSARSQLGQYVARFRALAPAAPPPTAPPPATPTPTTPPTPSGEAPPASTPEAPPALTAPPHTPPG
jgi:hypothetical protein